MMTRKQIYTILILLSAGLMLGQIIATNRTDTLLLQQSRFSAVNNIYNEREKELEKQLEDGIVSEGEFSEQSSELEKRRQQALDNERRELPVFSANDRSRWATIRVLVEPDMRVQQTVTLADGTEKTETVWYAIDKAQNVRGWDTIDMVKHDIAGRDMKVLQVQQTLTPPSEGLDEKEIEEKTERKFIWSITDKWIDGWEMIEIGTDEGNAVQITPAMRVQQTTTLPNGTVRTDTVWYAKDPDGETVSEFQALYNTLQGKIESLSKIYLRDANEPEVPERPGLENRPGTGYLYSSKPPLLPTLMAIPYALIYKASDGKITLDSEPFLVVRTTLILCNLLPMILCWFLLARLIERFGTTDWGRLFSVAFVCFGTFLSTFSITLNNHSPAVVCITIAFYSVVRIVFDKETRLRYFAAAGFFGAFAVVCELPALLFLALIGFWILCHNYRRTLFVFLPAALIVAGGYFATNYVAHQTLFPAYSQPEWYFFEYERGGRVLQSHWHNPQGLDKGEPDQMKYVFHSTVGHHGLFSLTPVWILSFIGLAFWLVDRRYWSMSLIILFTSLVVFAFYMTLKLELRNYGGNTSALRWMFWLAPLWSTALVAAADRFGRLAFFRAIALLCLFVSAMSAAYPTWNPWTMPWTYNLLQYLPQCLQ